MNLILNIFIDLFGNNAKNETDIINNYLTAIIPVW